MATRLIAGLLYGVEATDVSTFVLARHAHRNRLHRLLRPGAQGRAGGPGNCVTGRVGDLCRGRHYGPGKGNASRGRHPPPQRAGNDH